MPRYHIINFGCRANQADGAALEEELSQRGFAAAEGHQSADLVILNSCTVTAAADYGVRQAARRVHRDNPSARILVTGCYAQRRPEDLAALPGVNYVVGNSHKRDISSLVSLEVSSSTPHTRLVSIEKPTGSAVSGPVEKSRSSAALKILRGDIFTHQNLLAAPAGGGDRTRPNLKIQDGCNNRCSFCVIPYVRGRSRSLPLSEVLRQVRSLCDTGYKEVVLSGINLGRYGRDLPGGKPRLAYMARAILDETPLERLRLSSVEPMDFTNELLDLMAASPRIAKHVHAPLQSGSDRILRLMHRKYHPRHYRDRLEAAFSLMPNAAFGADVMVGFPGESDADFELTRSFIDSLPFTYLHVFPFSSRPGTPAEQMKGQVNGAVVRERARILRDLAAGKNLRFRQRQLGRSLDVITLGKADSGGTLAISDHFLDVLVPGEKLEANQIVRVRITGVDGTGLVGKVAERRFTSALPASDSHRPPR